MGKNKIVELAEQQLETSTQKEKDYQKMLALYFDKSTGSVYEKLKNFPKYTRRQDIALFLYKYELFKQILDVQGSIVECGVHHGGGMMSFAHFSSILEPYNYQRKVFGFDTFEGFPEVTDEDKTTDRGEVVAKVGLLGVDKIEEDLDNCIKLYDMNRPLGHVSKIELVKGDVNKTMPLFLKKNPHLIISLLYLDMDLYKPTKSVLELLISRVPKGGIIALDEVNNPLWPGETQAVQEVLGINNLRLKRMSFEPIRSYFIVE